MDFLVSSKHHIFIILESVGSARIEGNRTTISEYIEEKMRKKERVK